MAEENKDFEKQIADEEAQLKAEAERLARESQPPPPEEAKAAEPIPPEEKPVEPAPAVETKPAEPEVKPEPKRDGAAWKLLRQRERELEEARTELARRDAAGKPPAEPDFENQPADYLRNRTERIEQELRQTKAEMQRRDFLDNIKRQEDDYAKAHPDYWDATKYLIENDIKEWERTGASAVQTSQILAAARSTDPRYQPYRDNIQRLANDPGVLSEAEKQGRDPEELGAWVIARDTWLTGRRDLIAEGAKATGRSVAEIAYEIAKERGFGRGATQETQQQQAARARVEQAKRVSEATHSLSESATAEAAPEVKILRNRQQILDLDDETLDNLIKSGKYRELS